MFGLFKKELSPADFLNRLKPYYTQVVTLINSIDGPFVNNYEAGIFVASIATSKILTFKKVNPRMFADHFNNMWVDYIVDSYSDHGGSLSKDAIMLRLQEKFPVYRELFLNTIDPKCKGDVKDNAVQLMWELFSNCTGKESPNNFTRLVIASGDLAIIGMNILKDTHE